MFSSSLLQKQLETAIESLKECLENKAVVNFLDESTKKSHKGSERSECSWQNVFLTCHKNVLAVSSLYISLELFKTFIILLLLLFTTH